MKPDFLVESKAGLKILMDLNYQLDPKLFGWSELCHVVPGQAQALPKQILL